MDELINEILEEANNANGIKSKLKNHGNHKGVSIKEYAAKHGYKAIDKLVEIIEDYDSEKPAGPLVQAISVLLDRGFGKPTQAVEVSGEVAMVSDVMLDEIYQNGMAKIEEMRLQQEQRMAELRSGALH